MSLPYERATSGQSALNEVQKVLQRFGCASFGNMMDYERGELIVQFQFRGMPVTVKASINGYAAAWLKQQSPAAQKRASVQQKARSIASVAVYSILRDWIKGQITAIETGMLTFEGAFLGQLLLPSGKTVLEEVSERDILPAAQEKVVMIGAPK